MYNVNKKDFYLQYQLVNFLGLPSMIHLSRSFSKNLKIINHQKKVIPTNFFKIMFSKVYGMFMCLNK